MATPDVRVKLSAEGVSEVVAAFRKVEAEAGKAAAKSTKAMGGLSTALGQIKSLLPAIGAAAVVGGLGRMAKQGLDTADSIGKLSQKVGAGTEALSVLAFAATTADVSQEQLGKGLVFLARNVDQLRQGTEKQVEAFGRLGLSIKDFSGKDTAEQFALIASKLGNMKDQGAKTALAFEIFGKAGAELIPLLNDVGVQGFDALRQRAEDLGLVIDTDTAAAAQAANDAFTTIGNQAKGLALQFASGFAPAVAGAMQRFTEDTKGKGKASMMEFGQSVARVVITVVNTFRLLGNVVGSVFGGIGRQIGGFAAAAAALFRGDFREAARIWATAGEDGRRDFAAFQAQFKTDLKRLVDDANRDPPKFELRPELPTGDLEGTADKIAEAAAEKQRKEAERLAKEQARLREQEAREQERLANERSALEVRLLELAGQTRAARLAGLEEEIRKADELLQKQKVGDAERLATLEKLRTMGTAEIDFEEMQAQAQRAFAEVEQARQRIENDVALGLQTQVEGQAALAAIEAERLVTLQQIAAAALAAAQATGNAESIAAAQALNTEVQTLEVSLKKTSDAFEGIKEGAVSAAETGLSTFLLDVTSGAKSAGDAVRGLAASFAAAMAQMIAQALAAAAVKKILASFGGGFAEGGLVGGGATGYATGGRVSGPGSGTSDSIPAWLSHGEFVVRAAVVQQPGVLSMLEALNDGLAVPAYRSGRRRFAEGGLAMAAPAEQARSEQPVRIVNVLDPDLVTEALGSSSGERTILNVMQRNKAGIKRILR